MIIRSLLISSISLALSLVSYAGAPPVITGVSALQRPGTKLVDIAYTISDPDSTTVNIGVAVSNDSGQTWTVPATSFTVTEDVDIYWQGLPGLNRDVGPTPGQRHIVWNAGADWDGHFTANCRVRIIATDDNMPIVLGGPFIMGYRFAFVPELRPVFVSPFMIERYLVTGALWNRVVEGYGRQNGYTDVPAANQLSATAPAFKEATHPVYNVNWYQAVKWCNARSQMEGLTPVYYVDETLTTVYKAGGPPELQIPFVKWNANGYRLPTDAEWEKAARGGLVSKLFPGGDVILNGPATSGGLANYNSISFTGSGQPYDGGPFGFNSAFNDGVYPYTSPVGYFASNGFGLYDMAGNIFQWCWDGAGSSTVSGATDPHGPASGTHRLLRGGSWNNDAAAARCDARSNDAPTNATNTIGFRCVRGL